jgi:hypothetical protein
VPTGNYGPAWTNYLQQTVQGVNGYAVQNTPFDSSNGLNASMQVLATSDGVGFTYQAKSGSSGNSPAAFPAIVSGWGPGSGGVQLYGPYQANVQIKSLQTVKSTWAFTMGSSGDAAYDLWLGASQTTASPAVELMIWIGNTGKTPLGSKTGTAVMGSDGVARTPHYNATNQSGQQVISYVPSSGSTSVTNFDLLPYITDAATSGKYPETGLSNTQYLLSVQAGFEVYSADTWKTTDYNITIK